MTAEPIATETPRSSSPIKRPFPRLEEQSTIPSPWDESPSMQNGSIAIPPAKPENLAAEADGKEAKALSIEESSVFNTGQETQQSAHNVSSPVDSAEQAEELPVEIISLCDRFVDSLSAKIYKTPPSIEKLSSLFQDFYSRAESHIATHVKALSTPRARATSSSTKSVPATPLKVVGRSASRDTLNSQSSVLEQQLLTPQEISDRRRARRLLDRKAISLGEAVERGVCERIYERIWRHRSTLDEVRDDKLRSKTAALALVGIGLPDLGVDAPGARKERSSEDDDDIEKASKCLLYMNDSKYPQGKLQQLAAAHKHIVNFLAAVHHASSSADEILPTLIFTLISTPPEGINIISNLNFIQRFRGSSRMDGEAAYCLTNLEAAITFLETVDLASLRADETPEARAAQKASPSRPTTPQGTTENHGEPLPPALQTSMSVPPDSSLPPAETTRTEAVGTTIPSKLSTRTESGTSVHRRRVSELLQPPANALGAAGDAVRNTADQGIKSIGSALDTSFSLLFGRLSEQKAIVAAADTPGSPLVPKTLDDARKLIDSKPNDDENLLSETSSLADKGEDHTMKVTKPGDGVLDAIVGKRPARDKSTESNSRLLASQNEAPFSANAAVESMRNFGSSLNPLRGFGGMNVMRGFGRPTTPSVASSTVLPSTPAEPGQLTSHENIDPSAIKTLPPIARFMDVQDPQDLSLKDIPELLQDYKRLAEALRTMNAF